jgi:polyhydroxyalkanoate synthesis regulator phasin
MKPTPKKPVTVVAAQRLNEGLGVARKQLANVEKEIVTEARKQRKSIEKVLARVRSGSDLKQFERRITTTATDLRKRVMLMPREVMSALGVATSDDMAKLTRNLSKLSKRVDELAKSRQTF